MLDDPADLPACASPGGASPLPSLTPAAGAQTGWPVVTAVAGYTPSWYGTLELSSPASPEWVDLTIDGLTQRVSVVGDRDDWQLPEIDDPTGRVMAAATDAIDDAVEEYVTDRLGPPPSARFGRRR